MELLLVLICLEMPALKNKVHERFAQAVAAGKSQSEAWRIAKNSNNPNAGGLGHMLAKRQDISERIEELAEKTIAKFEMSREDAVEMVVKMLKMSPKDASMDSPLCDIKYVGKDADAVAVTPDRLRAMERLARMMGWDKEVHEHTAGKDVLEALGQFCE